MPVLDVAAAPLGATSVVIPAVRFDAAVQHKAEQILQRVGDDLRRHLMPRRPVRP